jgi:aminoglycoside 6'-N-acetyltransferase
MVFRFKPLQKQDYAMFANWLAQPHVAKWWREPPTIEFVEKEYGPRDKKTDVYVIEGDGKPMGIIQSYRIDDYPDHQQSLEIINAVGLDLFIGIVELTGKGFGSQLVKEFIDTVIRKKYPDAHSVVVDPEVANIASVKMFEKVGFQKRNSIVVDHRSEQIMSFSL